MSKITKEMIQEHGLTPDEFAKIQEILGRDPNLTELGVFSVMWSEHCSYKSSKKYLKNFYTKNQNVIIGPGENAGVIDIGDNDAICFKMESHNHPSFIEPFQGATTGVGGILRDVFTMGARPIANLNSLRFGNPYHEKTSFLVNGVVAGIAHYGNCMGIPTVGGEVYFDDCYNGNILVNAMTAGLVKKDKIFLGVASGIGNPVIYVGSKTGRDGIHGATMASDSFDDSSEQKRPTVQVGDPFTEKLLLEACLEVMQTDAIVGIQDMGAAGLTSSTFEMASRAGTGIEMNLDKIPQREKNMTAYEMLLSESQERMVMVVKPESVELVKSIFDKWDLDCEVVGKVTNTKNMVIKHQGKVVVDIPVDPLALASPEYDRPVQKPKDLEARTQDIDLEPSEDLRSDILTVLSSPTIASKKWIYKQYDHMVMTNTHTLPGTDAAFVRIEDSKKAIALTTNCNSRYVFLNPKEGAKIAVAESARNIVCSGATPLAITDCLNFGNPEDPEVMWQFKEACQGINDACEFLDTPVVSGNVSLYNQTDEQNIFPTPSIGMVGLLKDYQNALTMGFEKETDVIILLGETYNELGGSEYLKQVSGEVVGKCPKIDLKKEKQLHDFVLHLNQKRILKSAHDLSEGGLITALIECAHQNQMGFKVEFEVPTMNVDEFLFSESQSRILITIAKESIGDLLPELKSSNVPFFFIGDVRNEGISIRYNGDFILQDDTKGYFDCFEKGFENCL